MKPGMERGLQGLKSNWVWTGAHSSHISHSAGRKRKAPSSQQKKARKKTRTAKVLNTHLASDLLKDYSEGSFTGK